MLRSSFLVILLAVSGALFQGCSDKDAVPSMEGKRNQVSLVTRVDNNFETLGSGEAFPDGKDRFRLCGFIAESSDSPEWTIKCGTEAFENEPVDVYGGKPSTRTPRYYPPTGYGKMWFYAYAPADGATYVKGTETQPPYVDYNLTGQQDIMTATVIGNGIGTALPGEEQKQPSFMFRHLLKRLTFRLVQGEGFATDITVSEIRIVDCHTHAKLDISSGELSFPDDSKGSLRVSGTWAIRPWEEAKEIPNVWLLCEPGNKVTLEVVAAGITYHSDVTFENAGSQVGAVGVSHLVTLTFKGTQIVASSTLTEWNDVGSASGNIK